jgi:CRP-like cAMP-binding protein
MVLLDMLEDLEFLRGMSPDDLGRVRALGELEEYPPGTVLFHEGQACYHVYLVLSGQVSLAVDGPGGKKAVGTVTPGELLGWSPLLGLGPMTATARAVTRCRLVALDVRSLLRQVEQAPQFGVEFLRRTAATMSQRLASTRHRLVTRAARRGARSA